MGCADLVRRPRHAGGPAGQGRIPEGVRGRGGRLGRTDGRGGGRSPRCWSCISTRTTRSRAWWRTSPRCSPHSSPRRSALARRRSLAALTLGFFSSLNAAIDPLRHRPGADRLRRGLSDAGTVVAHRLPDLAGAPRDLAASRVPLVEGDWVVVTDDDSNRNERSGVTR